MTIPLCTAVDSTADFRPRTGQRRAASQGILTHGQLFHGGALTPLSVVATVVAALIVPTARDTVQMVLSRLHFGRRREPESIVLAMTRRRESAAGPGEMLEAVATDPAEALKLEAVTITTSDGERLAGSEPEPRATVAISSASQKQRHPMQTALQTTSGRSEL